MGGTLAKLEGTIHIVMVGLDAAGKTTVLYKLKNEEYIQNVPTVGFNCEKIKRKIGKTKGVSFIVWDVGGQDKVRPLWRAYTRSTDGIVFVVDAADCDRLEEAKVELLRTARTAEDIPILIIANKQDIPGALDSHSISSCLSVREVSNNGSRMVEVVPACAVTGDGLEFSLEQLYQMILKRRKRKK